MKSIITFTPNPCLDETRWMDGDKELRRSYQTGGKGVNVARVLASLGNKVTALAPLYGAAGEKVLALAKEEGFSLEALPCQGETRTVVTCVQESTFEQVQHFQPGSMLTLEHMDAIRQNLANRLDSCDLLVLSGRLPEGALKANPQATLDLYPSLIRLAHSKGVPVWLDCHGAGFLEAATAGPDFFKPNLEEALELADQLKNQENAGSPFSLSCAPWGAEQTQRLLPLLDYTRSATLLISLGEEGVFTWQKGQEAFFPPYRIETVNPVGSGDSFVAGWLHGWCKGYDMAQCIRLAQAAGAANASMWVAAQISAADILGIDPALASLL
ncbi:PfkB family carbohydrate kinase [Oscillospiraceae bacterium MB08-C2-2]|nr:PfkB family carbohydrate kinase [Oscillospiraceae bacterium MB08-C2-2]